MGSRRAVSSARGNSGNSGLGSCDGRRPSATRRSHGGARWPTPRASVPAPVPRSRPWAGAPPRARGETWNDSGVHSRQPLEPAEVDLDSLVNSATRSAWAMRGIVLDAEVILVDPPRIKPTLRAPGEPAGSD